MCGAKRRLFFPECCGLETGDVPVDQRKGQSNAIFGKNHKNR
jgi:hypothetical protein